MNNFSEMKNAIDIVDYIGRYVELKKVSANEYSCICPFHKENTPSFFVNRAKQQFICFSCGLGGDIITFIQKYHKVTFSEAIQILEMETGKAEQPKRIIIDEARKYISESFEKNNRIYLFRDCMEEYPKCHKIEEWMKEGISEEVLSKHDVRYSKDKTKIMFPIIDENGNIISIKYRNLYTKPKYMYLNKIGKKDFLYNFNYAKKYIEGLSECILVESEKSVMKLETWGIYNAVAVGSHCISDEINLLIKTPFNDLVFAYDEDVQLKEILSQIKILRHYKNIYYIKCSGLPEKYSPCDCGFEKWSELYNKKEKI